MTEANKEYWNQFGLLRAQTYENDQNGLLRLAYYHLFSSDILDRLTIEVNAEKAMNIMESKGKYAQHPETTWDKDRASHDELASILYFLSIDSVFAEKIKNIKIGYYLKYPQVLFHLLAIKHESKILAFIAGLVMLIGVYKKEKARNGQWDTDSELLALIKLETYNQIKLKQFFKIQTLKQIQKNWGINYPKTLVDTMLWYAPEHPLRVLLDK